MFCSKKFHIALFSAVCLGYTGFVQPSFSAFYYAPHPSTANPSGGADDWQPTTRIQDAPDLQDATQSLSRGGSSINWPTDSINLSQLQALFSKFPGLSKLNIQFPNQTNWGITPDQIRTLSNNYQLEAKSMGVTDKIPDLLFSSLSGGSLKAGALQLAIANLKNGGDIKGQMDDLLRQVRYDGLNLGNGLPDWLKRVLLAVYDAVYQALTFAGGILASMFR